MSTCKRCPAWAYSHVVTENNVDVLIGFCRFDPPKVFREQVKHPETGEPAFTSGAYWPPTRESHWCIRGRVLMEKTGQTEPTMLTEGAPK